MSIDKTALLIVDDKPARLLTYEAILESLDLDLVRAGSGQAALDRLAEADYAAILLDVNMPGLNGFETAAKIRDHPRGSQTPIIFVTGIHVSDLERLRGYEMGAADYVYVPVVPEILRGKVRVLVQLYEQRLEVSQLNEKLVQANTELARAHKQLKADNTRELQKLNASLALANRNLKSEVGERRRAEQQLKEAARRKDEFISILAHELRNPLSAIHSGIELMRMPSLAQSKLEWARELVERQLRHLVRLIDDLLDVSRVTSGRVQLQREIVDLRTVIEESVDAARAQIDERRHDLVIDLPGDALYVDGDVVRLGQVFGNLLANASKYMEPGGRIEVGAATQPGAPDRVVVRVRDHGAGLRADMLEHVFELFAQAEPAGSRMPSGLGIGLALVRSLVELHGGTVRAASEGPDHGAEFTVELPLSDDRPARGTEPAPDRACSPLRLLIVDDNVDAAQGLVLYFEQTSPHEVRMVHSGMAGVAAAEEFEPDVVLLDIGLPDIDGYEVARRLRALPRLEGVALVAVTGFGRDVDRERARAAAFDHFLTKPVAHPVLEHVLAACSSAPALRRAGGGFETRI
jgi:signal transduction histidine kinase